MNCREFETDVAEYVAGRLDKPRAAQVRSHALGCDECARREASERAMRRVFGEIPDPASMPDVWPRLSAAIKPRVTRPLWQRGWTVGGAFAGMAAAGLALVCIYGPMRPQMSSDSGTSMVVRQDAPAKAPVKNADEEKVVHLVQQMRSNGSLESETLAQDGQTDRDARLVLLGGRGE